MSFRCLLAAGVAITSLATMACSNDSEDAVPLTTMPSVTATTRASTTSTTVDFETEVKLAALELLEIRNEVLQNPDVGRVSEYIAETCVCLERERQIIVDFVAQGRRWTGPAIVPLGVRLSNDDAAGPAVTIAAHQPAAEIVGPGDAETVRQVDEAPYLVTLVRDARGAWLINGLTGITLESATFDAIVGEGLP